MSKQNNQDTYFVTELSGELLYALVAHALGKDVSLCKMVAIQPGAKSIISYDFRIKNTTNGDYEKPNIQALESEAVSEIFAYVKSYHHEFIDVHIVLVGLDHFNHIRCLGKTKSEALLRAFCLFKLGAQHTFTFRDNATLP